VLGWLWEYWLQEQWFWLENYLIVHKTAILSRLFEADTFVWLIF